MESTGKSGRPLNPKDTNEGDLIKNLPMSLDDQTRRTVLRSIGVGLTGGVANVGSASASSQELTAELNRVRNLTLQYRDIDTARSNGYAAVSPYVPGMGFHFADGPPFGKNLENPGILVYFTNGSYNPVPGEEHDSARDDDLILGAVEWLVPGDQEDKPPDIFSDESSDRELLVTEAEGWHFESAEGFTGLHAWVHRGNPAGVFHPTNPEID